MELNFLQNMRAFGVIFYAELPNGDVIAADPRNGEVRKLSLEESVVIKKRNQCIELSKRYQKLLKGALSEEEIAEKEEELLQLSEKELVNFEIQLKSLEGSAK